MGTSSHNFSKSFAVSPACEISEKNDTYSVLVCICKHPRWRAEGGGTQVTPTLNQLNHLGSGVDHSFNTHNGEGCPQGDRPAPYQLACSFLGFVATENDSLRPVQPAGRGHMSPGRRGREQRGGGRSDRDPQEGQVGSGNPLPEFLVHFFGAKLYSF